jgi:hypothetical protein
MAQDETKSKDSRLDPSQLDLARYKVSKDGGLERGIRGFNYEKISFDGGGQTATRTRTTLGNSTTEHYQFMDSDGRDGKTLYQLGEKIQSNFLRTRTEQYGDNDQRIHLTESNLLGKRKTAYRDDGQLSNSKDTNFLRERNIEYGADGKIKTVKIFGSFVKYFQSYDVDANGKRTNKVFELGTTGRLLKRALTFNNDAAKKAPLRPRDLDEGYDEKSADGIDKRGSTAARDPVGAGEKPQIRRLGSDRDNRLSDAVTLVEQPHPLRMHPLEPSRKTAGSIEGERADALGRLEGKAPAGRPEASDATPIDPASWSSLAARIRQRSASTVSTTTDTRRSSISSVASVSTAATSIALESRRSSADLEPPASAAKGGVVRLGQRNSAPPSPSKTRPQLNNRDRSTVSR